MNKKQKLITASVAGATAMVALIGGTLALFTARADSDFTAKAGTVSVNVDKLAMTNSGNINPGDNDPANPEGAVAGTDHDFTYVVTNQGTKSIRTRHTLILTCTENTKDAKLLDARYLALYDNKAEVVTKSYILEDNSEVTSLDKVEKKVKAVKYVFLSDVFNGFGKDAEIETVQGAIAEKDGAVSKEYLLDFALLRGATNEYQACNVNIEVVVEAMQYRNTAESDWSEVSRVVREFSTADVSINVIPDENENINGEVFKSESTTESKKEESTTTESSKVETESSKVETESSKVETESTTTESSAADN